MEVKLGKIATVVAAGLVGVLLADQLTRPFMRAEVASELWAGRPDTLVVFAHGMQASNANAKVLRSTFRQYGDTLVFQEGGDISDTDALVIEMAEAVREAFRSTRTGEPRSRIIFYGESKGGHLLTLVASWLKSERDFADVPFYLVLHQVPAGYGTLHKPGRTIAPLLGTVRTGKLVNLLPIIRWGTPAESADAYVNVSETEKQAILADREHALSQPFSLWTSQLGFDGRQAMTQAILSPQMFKGVYYLVDTLDTDVVDGFAAATIYRQLRSDLVVAEAPLKHVDVARNPRVASRAVGDIFASIPTH